MRHHLYEALKTTIGDEATVALMESLPPAGWVDVVKAEALTATAALFLGITQLG